MVLRSDPSSGSPFSYCFLPSLSTSSLIFPKLKTIFPITVSGDPGFTDGLLGVRFTGELSDRWDYLLRLDGSAGDSEGTLNAVAGFGYSFGNKGNKRFLFGYRHMQIETKREGNSDLQVELTMSGPIAGFEFRF